MSQSLNLQPVHPSAASPLTSSFGGFAATAAALRRWRKSLNLIVKPLLVILTVATAVITTIAVNTATRSAAAAASRIDPAAGVVSLGTNGMFRVATYNMHSGVGVDGKLDLDRIARSVRGADLVALNEVHAYHTGRVESQAERLGSELGMSHLFAPTERRWWGDDFGNAVLSKVPLNQWQRIPLPSSQSRGYRNVVLLTAHMQGRPVKVLVTHLDTTRDRKQQLDAVADLSCSLQPPVLLMGDLNTPYGDPIIQPLLDRPDVVNALSAEYGANPPKDVEYILARGLQPVAAGSTDNGGSDHCCVWADLKLP